MVLLYLKERSLRLTRLEENPDAAEGLAVGAVAAAALQQQQAQQESLVEGDWVLLHEAGGRPGSPGSQRQDGLCWIEKSKSVKKWLPWRRNQAVIPLEAVCC